MVPDSVVVAVRHVCEFSINPFHLLEQTWYTYIVEHFLTPDLTMRRHD